MYAPILKSKIYVLVSYLYIFSCNVEKMVTVSISFVQDMNTVRATVTKLTC